MAPILIISEQVRLAIAGHGLSLNEVARRAGIQPSQVSRFMRGERGLTTESLDKLAEVLGLELRKKKQ